MPVLPVSLVKQVSLVTSWPSLGLQLGYRKVHPKLHPLVDRTPA
jgi:hypothetical protein